MRNRKKFISFMAGLMAAVMLLTLIMSLVPVSAGASSYQIRQEINKLKKEKDEIAGKIKEVQEQYEENEDEIADIIAKKNVVDQEIQLLNEQINNINEQISAFNILIADKQDELDKAQGIYLKMSEENKIRVRAMEEEGELSYWEVLFKANTFSDLLDRLSMVEEIAAADAKHLQEMSDAAEAVELAQNELESEKKDLEYTKAELDATQHELDGKRAEVDELIQELLSKADDLEALEAEFEEKAAEFQKEIASMEVAYTQAVQAEWAAHLAKLEAEKQQAAQQAGNNNGGTANGGNSGSSGGSSGGTSVPSGGWVWPTTSRRISSPFGTRTDPFTGKTAYHGAIDIDGNTGDPIYATRSGIVALAGYGSAAGNWVKIDHQDGFMSIYMHLNSYSVRAGQVVSTGQYIGAMGESGRATGDHLHFAITKNGVDQNPLAYVG